MPTYNLTNLRKLSHSSELRMTVIPMSVLLSAQVTGTPTRGQRSITYGSGTGDLTYIVPWLRVHIGSTPGAKDIAVLRVKSITGTATTGTIEFDENGILWAAGQYITVYHFFSPYVIQNRPYYPGSGQVWNQYKFYDTAYASSGNANSLPGPVCIAGTHQVGELSGSTFTFNIDLSDSYTMTPGATKTAYTLDVAPATGATVTFSGATGIGTVEVSTTGTWWALASVTDSNGKSEYRVFTLTTEPPVIPGYVDFALTSFTSSYGAGASFGIDAWGQVQLSDFPDGTLVILWTTGQYADVLDVGNIVTCGYIRSDRTSDDLSSQGVHQVSFECSTLDGVLDNMPMNDLELRAYSTVDAWYKYASWLYMGAGIHHYLRWHSNVLQVTDVLDLTNNQDPVFTIRWNMGTVRGAINEQANKRGIFAQLTADEAGRLYLAEDIQMWNTTDRNAVSTLFTITLDDIGGDITIVRSPENKLYRAMLGGTQVQADGTKVGYISIIPGYIDSTPQRIMDPTGSGSLELTNMVVVSQTDSDEKVGRVFAYENREIREMRLRFRGNYIGAMTVIPRIGWYGWGVSQASLSRNIALPTRWLCKSISVTSNHDGDFITEVKLEPEVFGPNGVIGRFPTNHPGTPPTEPPEWQGPEGVKAVMTWSSTHFRLWTGSGWESISTEDFYHGTIDAWWKQYNNSVNPENVVWWGVGPNGLVSFFPNLRADPVSRSPVATLDEWGTAIPVSDVTMLQILTDEWLYNRKYLLGQAQESTNWRGWLFVSDDFGQTWDVVSLYNTKPTSTFPLWMAVSNERFHVTVWRDGSIYLLTYPRDFSTGPTEISLGTASIDDIDNRVKWAFPVRVQDANTSGYPVYVAGRLVDTPLTGTHHILKYTGTWASIQSGWGTGWCASLKVSTDPGGGVRNVVAYRQA